MIEVTRYTGPTALIQYFRVFKDKMDVGWVIYDVIDGHMHFEHTVIFLSDTYHKVVSESKEKVYYILAAEALEKEVFDE